MRSDLLTINETLAVLKTKQRETDAANNRDFADIHENVRSIQDAVVALVLQVKQSGQQGNNQSIPV
jgi:hypothetical protein